MKTKCKDKKFKPVKDSTSKKYMCSKCGAYSNNKKRLCKHKKNKLYK